MIPPQVSDPFYSKVLAEHRELNSLLVSVEDRLNRALGADPNGNPMWIELTERLKSLRDYLEHHFAEEEEGGVLEEAMCRLPRLCPRAAALERQHGELRKQMARIVEQAERCGCSAERRQAVARDFSRFAYALRAHEAAENCIAEEAFCDGNL
jgi:hypothetical protein